ncbi:MAG: hypothetical protein ACW98X_24875 [Promethearchaeota archaeon]|jgi:hypothetical protein
MASRYTREEIKKVQEVEGCDYQEAQRIMAWRDGLITVWDEEIRPGWLFVYKQDKRFQMMFTKKTKDNLLFVDFQGVQRREPWVDPEQWEIVKV